MKKILLAATALFLASTLGACSQATNAHSKYPVKNANGMCEVNYADVGVTTSVVTDVNALTPAMRKTGVAFAVRGVLIRHSNNDVVYVSESDAVQTVTRKSTPEMIRRIMPMEIETANAARQLCKGHLPESAKVEDVSYLGLF